MENNEFQNFFKQIQNLSKFKKQRKPKINENQQQMQYQNYQENLEQQQAEINVVKQKNIEFNTQVFFQEQTNYKNFIMIKQQLLRDILELPEPMIQSEEFFNNSNFKKILE